MSRTLSFQLRGIPVPYNLRGGGNVHTTTALKTWKSQVRAAAEEAMDAVKWEVLPGPAELRLTFLLLRRGRKRKGLLAAYPVGKPDTTSLLRGIEDALTEAGVWDDDSQVVNHVLRKRYAAVGAEQGPEHGFVGVKVEVIEITEGP